MNFLLEHLESDEDINNDADISDEENGLHRSPKRMTYRYGKRMNYRYGKRAAMPYRFGKRNSDLDGSNQDIMEILKANNMNKRLSYRYGK